MSHLLIQHFQGENFYFQVQKLTQKEITDDAIFGINSRLKLEDFIDQIKSIELLGTYQKLKFAQDEKGTLVELPKTLPSKYALSLRILIK